MIKIEQALTALGATDWIIVNESTYSNIKWKDDIVLFTEEETNTKLAQLKSEFIPQPKWEQFMIAMEPFFAKGLTANYTVFTQMFNMLLILKDKNLPANTSFEWRNFQFNWNMIKPAFTAEEIIQIETAMIEANIPIT